MELPLYQIDAFTDTLFGGNPAAVCPLSEWIDESLMQAIAAENNLAETAFFVPKGEEYEIRWFMPHDEIDLCGHATLAAAYVIFHFLEPQRESIHFHSQSGRLIAQKAENEAITLDFPARPPVPVDIPEEVFAAFNYRPTEAAAARDLILLFESEAEIRNLQHDLSDLKALPYLCIVATAEGTHCDFVSRVFDANADMPEDPVTGSAHASLTPYWQQRLGKSSFTARQLSERGGELICTIAEGRVFMTGKAKLYLKGEIYLPT